jgi:DNA invertase Pin-like site-specific DNA recombinase
MLCPLDSKENEGFSCERHEYGLCWVKAQENSTRESARDCYGGLSFKDDRLGLAACLKALQPGNTLVVWKLDRLGRDLKHLVNTIDELSQRDIGLKVLSSAGAQIDTTTAKGRLVFGIFAALAEFEAELIRERTPAALTAARVRGRLGGRPRKMTQEVVKMAMAAMADPQAKPSEVARRLGITTTTLYAYVNGDGTVKATGQRLLENMADGRGLRTASRHHAAQNHPG